MKRFIISTVIVVSLTPLFCSAYTPSAAISYSNQTNIVIDGKSFTTGTNGAAIYLTNCNNVKITNCRFSLNSGIIGVRLAGCSNVEISGNIIENFNSGVYATSCTGGIDIHCNMFNTIAGTKPRGQMVQFNGCNGAGNRVNYNTLDTPVGVGGAEDLINMYNSSGTAADPIQINGNKLRGGGPSTSGGGIMLGDNGSHDLICDGNTLVDPGQYGISSPSGYNVVIKNNKIFSSQHAWSNVGLYVGVQSEIDAGFTCNGPTIQVLNNQVKWTNKNGINNGWYNCPCCPGVVQSGNNFNAPIDASILPATLTLDSAACGAPQPTFTFTKTFTAQATRTFTPVSTKTSTQASTKTFTATVTFTPVNTRTATPANTKTYTLTATPTPTLVSTATRTMTHTQTSTAISTKTFTPSRTIIITSSATATQTYTAIETKTFTATLTVSLTATKVNTATFTCTAANTATLTATRTGTTTPEKTSTATALQSRTDTATGTATITITFNPSASFTATASSTITITPNLSPSFTPTPIITGTFTSTCTATIAVSCTFTQTAFVTPTATMTATPDTSGALAFDGPDAVICFPNPVKGNSDASFRFNIKGYADEAEVRLFTVSGRLIRKIQASGRFYEGRNVIVVKQQDISTLAGGSYYYQLILSNSDNTIKQSGVMLLLR